MTDDENSQHQSKIYEENRVDLSSSSENSQREPVNAEPSTADNTNSAKLVRDKNLLANAKEFDENGNESSLAPLGGEFQTPAKVCGVGSATKTRDNHFIFDESMLSKKNAEQTAGKETNPWQPGRDDASDGPTNEPEDDSSNLTPQIDSRKFETSVQETNWVQFAE